MSRSFEFAIAQASDGVSNFSVTSGYRSSGAPATAAPAVSGSSAAAYDAAAPIETPPATSWRISVRRLILP